METINLLSHKDFKAKTNETGQIADIILSSGMRNLIYSKLETGGEIKKLVYTQDLRAIGKTCQLIRYAKSHGYNVVVFHEAEAQKLRKEYNYENIYGQMNRELEGKIKLVIDESVTLGGYIKEKNVITGFTNLNVDKVEESLTEKVVKALDEDTDSLLGKLKASLDNNNFSNYKMFINNLKDTVNLKQSLDWKLLYSEYSTQVSGDTFQKQVAVWEQNGDGNIKNHKIWNVEENCKNK